MPFIRSSILERCVFLAASISLNREIISPYSCYTKKGVSVCSTTNSLRSPTYFLLRVY